MAIDTEHTGHIKATDLIRVLTENGFGSDDDQLIVTIKANYRDDDQVQYSNFMSTNMDPKVVEKEWRLFHTFSFNDRSNTGALNAAGI